MRSKIAIIGHGVVGQAYNSLFTDALVYDIKKNINTKDEINKNCEVALICVPTPMQDGGKCDLTAIENTFDWLNVPLIVIKSTVPVGTTTKLREKTGKKIIFNPEFLRAVSAAQDVLDETNIIIGGEPSESEPLIKAYNHAYKHSVSFHFTTSDNAEMIKYMRNCYLATKVTFLNEMKEIIDKMKLDFEAIRDLWVLDERMGPSHNEVPGPDGQCGYGGMCFPKDVNAMIHFAMDAGVNPALLKRVWDRNTEFREEFKNAHRYES
ncbi:UDP-glucose/GDP-mannose dehydrogenase family protein [Candidatus Parcubacteria bacterium]|nr:MAG: UDP-glucose/GDP-mannose dehydrogenase family protein [Candidatus Parcubacteria bacterium]